MTFNHVIPFLLFVKVILSSQAEAQTMKAINIIQNLKVYETFLTQLQEKERMILQKEDDFVLLAKSISSQYSFITLKLNVQRKKMYEDPTTIDEQMYCRISFEIVADSIVFKEIYHQDKARMEILEKEIRSNKNINGITWNVNPEQPFYHSNETVRYLTMADEIARLALNCTNGDDYRPGCFSEIQLGDEFIRMLQVNHMNSRSLNHKDNYSLRKLDFFIPLSKEVEKKERHFLEYTFGAMKIYFNDSSSQNNKPCGDKIIKKIEEVIARETQK